MRKPTLILFLFIFSAFNISSQFFISGHLQGDAEAPLPWVTVSISNTSYVGYTDGRGFFKFTDIKPGTYTLKFSLMGYETLTKKVIVSNKDKELGFVAMIEKPELIDGVTITANKIDKSTPTTLTSISKEEIEETNLGQDIPYLLQLTPSMVVTSDAGAGVGYSYMRIRGTDASRINVTINGIPLNDAESHGVFFVNMPDFASSLESVDIQRGAGTSTNGVGAFGASVNLFTNFGSEKPYGEINNSFGSFNTMKNTVKFGTGIINNRFSFDGRLSNIQSDGYLDRASSDLKSYYFSGQYAYGKNSLKFITFSGKERTYQAWGGTPEDSLETNRTYNVYTYENEVDDYQQTHYQLFYSRLLNENLVLNTALHYTKGSGFFEQFREDDDMATYGINPVITVTDTITTTDLIRRRWLDNDFYGGIFSLVYTSPTNLLKTTLGGGYNIYDGDHFGEVIWARFANNSNHQERYYDNNARKTDGNIYSKTSYQFTEKLNGFLDLQLRSIDYSFLGFDNNLNNIEQNATYLFFNPKVGFSYSTSSSTKFYTLFSVANKEPNRNDLTESSPTSRPQHETLYDLELGFKKTKSNYALSVNGYLMSYKNQLVATGALNDVGASTRTNIENSYRAGIEIEGGIQITKGLKWSGNLSLSQNKLKNWTEYVDNWDNWGKDTVHYSQSTLAFSPSIIGSSILVFDPYKQWDGPRMKNRIDKWTISFISKYVGEQFIDNTESQDRKLSAYLVHDFRMNYSIRLRPFKEIVIFGSIYNVFNSLYSANAWSYRYSSGGEFQQLMGFYPQATRNLLIGLNMKF